LISILDFTADQKYGRVTTTNSGSEVTSVGAALGQPRLVRQRACMSSRRGIWYRATRLTLLAFAMLGCLTGTAFAGDNPSGFYWGTDSGGPYPNNNSSNGCDSSGVPWLEPYIKNGDCGKYGGNFAEYGGYYNMASLACTGSDAYNSTALQDAYDNRKAGYGQGAGGYFDFGGPGVDPNYNGTTAEAYAWGQSQGNFAVNAYRGHSEMVADGLPLVIDVEDNGKSDIVLQNAKP
jgi:hypothetical protein